LKSIFSLKRKGGDTTFKRKYLTILVLVVCLTTTLFLGITTSGSQTKKTSTIEYDPWADTNDDGVIDMKDIYYLIQRFMTKGEPINKTALLLYLNSTVNELNATVEIMERRAQRGLLVQLPYASTNPINEPHVDAILHSLDIDQYTPGDQQSVFVYPPSTTITITGVFQRYNPEGHPPAVIMQAFFIYSWTPSWPPPGGYYYPLYDGIPGYYPGVKRSFSFNLTVPSEPGVYYLYFCKGAEYNMQDAVNQYTQPLWLPYAVITVGIA